MKCHYHFSWIDLFKISAGLELVESSYLKDTACLSRLFYHECLRVIVDKINDPEDQQRLVKLLKEVSLARLAPSNFGPSSFANLDF